MREAIYRWRVRRSGTLRAIRHDPGERADASVAVTEMRGRAWSFLGTGRTLAAFRIPGYPMYWIAGTGIQIANAMSVVTIGWMTLTVTDSALVVAGTFAARLVPALLLGIGIGGLVDRFDRRRTLVVAAAILCLALAATGGLASAGRLNVALLLVLSAAFGLIETVRGTAFQAYAFDLAGAAGATNALALGNVGGQLAVTVGSALAGAGLELWGGGPTLLVAAVVAGVPALAFASGGSPVRRRSSVPRVAAQVRRSFTLIARNRAVAWIALVVILNEVLGYAAVAVLPTFAQDVLHAGAAALGAFSVVRAVGGIVSLLLLARLGLHDRGGLLFVLVTLASGLSLVAFANSTVLVASLVILFVTGMCWGSLDTLAQSLLQRSVDDAERGTAMGLWYFAIGFAPLGLLALGASATVVGAPLALTVDAAILACVAFGLLGARRLRVMK